MDRKSLMEKWSPILEHEGVAPIKDNYRKEVTAVLLENQETAIKEDDSNAQQLYAIQDRKYVFIIWKAAIFFASVNSSTVCASEKSSFERESASVNASIRPMPAFSMASAQPSWCGS